MSIFSITERISHIDSYLQGIDGKIKARFGTNQNTKSQGPGFKAVFDHTLNKGQTKQVQAKVVDNMSQLPKGFDQYIDSAAKDASRKYGVDLPTSLVRSVIKQESGFNPKAKSHAGAEGLMQLMPATAKSLGVSNSSNPYQNVKGGVTYLAQMLSRFDGNVHKALAAYNAGPGAVEKYNGIPPYNETKNYVSSIMKDYLTRENYQSVDVVA